MPRKGYKQSKEHIQKIRQNGGPMLGKHHSEESKKKMSENHIGKISWNKGQKLSVEHKQKLRQSHLGQAAWNKGLKTPDEIKQKLRESWSPINKRIRGNKGIHNGILYQSSYELNFMKLLDEYKIPYERADNKNFRIKYIFGGNEHYYYPDFYLPRENLIVELKPYFKLKDLKTQAKLNAAKEFYNNKFLVITEQELPELIK